MKKIFMLILTVFAIVTVIFYSCKKENTNPQNVAIVNKPPKANAGNDNIITLPADSVLLDGSASSDPDGNIAKWHWSKISGPTTFTIVNDTSSRTVVKNLIEGTYQFELSVTDKGGLISKDTMQITVNKRVPVNHPPVANAGKDTTIILASCGSYGTAVLNGSGSTDPDSNIAAYIWYDIDEGGYPIANNNAITNVYNLLSGKYYYILEVRDSGGLSSMDTVQVTVINNNTPAEYNFNVTLSDTLTFLDNFYLTSTSPYDDDDPYYADVAGMSSSCSFAPIGNLNFHLSETDDTTTSNYSFASIGIYQDNSSIYIGGDLNISFKKLIQNGGGTFTGLFKVKQGSAELCSPGIFNDEFKPVILNVSGTLTIKTSENNGSTIKSILSMNITGKTYF